MLHGTLRLSAAPPELGNSSSRRLSMRWGEGSAVGGCRHFCRACGSWPGVARRQVTFSCLAKRKSPKRRPPRCAAPAGQASADSLNWAARKLARSAARPRAQTRSPQIPQFSHPASTAQRGIAPHPTLRATLSPQAGRGSCSRRCLLAMTSLRGPKVRGNPVSWAWHLPFELPKPAASCRAMRRLASPCMGRKRSSNICIAAPS